MTPVACRLVDVPLLAKLGGGSSHAQACLRCQAGQARRRRLQRELRNLGETVEPAPPGFTAAVLTALDVAPVTSLPKRHSGRWVAAGSAVLAAAVGTAVVVLKRGRPATG